MLIRVGISRPNGTLLRTARELRAPIMVSAGAYIRPWPKAERWRVPFPGFRRPAASLAGFDAALDSAGFVAMVVYRGYEWTVGQYVALAAQHPWTWWSQMDLCCEPEIAGERDTIRLRQAETARLYWLCAHEAERLQIARPMPILQGWHPDDYARAVDWWLPIESGLVGVGSVCRRQLHGPDGLEAVIDGLDRALPPGITLHLFGVKSEAVAMLAGHPRIASVDSMAWDSRSRYANFGKNTIELRAQEMRRWYARQLARLGVPGPPLQSGLPIPALDDPLTRRAIDEVTELMAAGEIELSTVSHHFIEGWIADMEDDEL